MRRAGAFSVLGVSFAATCLVLVCVLASPVSAQETDTGGIPVGTPANGVDTGNTNDPPDVVTIAANDCTVSPGASVTLEDGDGTQVQLVDGERGITITAPGGRPEIQATDGEFIGDPTHATFPTSDTSFDTDGDYTVAGSEGITCRDAADTNARTDDVGGDDADDRQYEPDDRQYGDDQDEVMIETVPDKPLPKTGGFPFFFGMGLMLLAATVLGARVIGRR